MGEDTVQLEDQEITAAPTRHIPREYRCMFFRRMKKLEINGRSLSGYTGLTLYLCLARDLLFALNTLSLRVILSVWMLVAHLNDLWKEGQYQPYLLSHQMRHAPAASHPEINVM